MFAVDGTKLAASASNHATRGYEQIAAEILAVAGRIRQLQGTSSGIRMSTYDREAHLYALLIAVTTADPLPESVDITIVFTTAGAGGTFGTLAGVFGGYSSERIGRVSARGTVAGLFLGAIGFVAALIWLPGRGDIVPRVAGVVGFLGPRAEDALWLAAGAVLTVGGVGLVDGGASAWVAYPVAALSAGLVVGCSELSEAILARSEGREPEKAPEEHW